MTARAQRPRHTSTVLLSLALVTGTTLAASAPGAPKDPGTLGWPPAPSRVRYPEPIQLPQDPATQQSLRESHGGVREFLRARPSWKATVDPYTQSVDRAFGDGLPSLLERHRGLLAAGLDPSSASLVKNEKASIRLPDPEARIEQFDLYQHGLPVLGAGLTIALRGENVFYLSTSVLGPVATSPVPRLDSKAALDSLVSYLGDPLPSLSSQREPSLAFYPRLEAQGATMRLKHHLVWILEVRPELAPVYEGYFAYVDAHDGQVLAFFPEAQTSTTCSADPLQARGTVTGGVRANRADDPEKSVNLPFARVNVNGTLVSADLNGRYPYFGGTASSALDGDFFHSHCAFCTGPSQPMALADESGDVDFGLGGSSQPSPVAGNGSSTPADRTTYLHVNQARLLLQKWNNAFFNEIDPFVNINSQCNAFSSSYMLGFFRGGGNCRNTGEIRDVIQHELGHTWDRTDGNGIADGGLSEWKGDLLALAAGGDSCAGESFYISGGPTSSCSGVRDLDEKAPGRNDHPLTPSVCPTCATITRLSNDCGGEVHCVGEIVGQATWHLLNNLRTGADYITGTPFPAGNPALSEEQARWILERLLVAGGPPMVTWNPTVSGTSTYDAMMITDDDNGNLSDGTPHASYINAAFGHHEIAESPQVPDSSDCAPLSDPIVSAVVDRDPATGLPLVRIDWTPVGGATTFDVYRNTRAGDGFLPLAQNVSLGPIVDPGVQVGETYRYFVAAVRKTGCAAISPGANVVALAVTPPELKVSSRILSESPGGSDGDGRIEPGERVRIQITLQEVGGTSSATGVSATLTSASPTFSPVVASGPVPFGTVPAGGTQPGASAFEVLVGPSIPCGGRVHLVVSMSGDDGCWLDGIDVPVATTPDGCAPSAAAFVEIVPGSPQIVGSGGDGDGIADNCETTTVAYQVRNSGTLASGPVVSTVSTAHPGVTFVPSPDCTLASLAPGAIQGCQFSFSLGSATSAGISFTATATSAGNPAPSVLDFVLGAETNPSVFSTITNGFEGFGGWTSQQFGLSLRHFSGLRSAHAGSLTVQNICAKLTSPPFQLHPSNPSTLSFQLYGDVEPLTDLWYDRANVHVIDVDTGQHTLLTPASGLAYNASGNPQGGLCHVSGQQGWAGNFATWNLVTFDLSAFLGRRVRIEINYGSDEGDDRDGIYVDDLAITNAAGATLPPDGQGNSCAVPEVSATAATVPLTVQTLPGDILRFTWQDLGPAYQYSLYAGTLGSFYSHGATPLVCQGLGVGVSCDGTSCTHDRAQGTLPAGDLYFLVTATGFGTEGTSGFSSSGAERDPVQSSCAP